MRRQRSRKKPSLVFPSPLPLHSLIVVHFLFWKRKIVFAEQIYFETKVLLCLQKDCNYRWFSRYVIAAISGGLKQKIAH